MAKKLPVADVSHPALASPPAPRVNGPSPEAFQVPADDRLESLSQLVQRARELEAEVAEAKEMMDVRAGRLRHLVEERIPSLMDELGLESFKTSTGASVTVAREIGASLAQGKDEPEGVHALRVKKALAWLEANGHDGIIKTTVSVALAKGETERAEEIAAALTQLGVDFKKETSVHSSTLKAFAKERLKAEPPQALPVDLFRVTDHNRAKITAPKEK